MKRLKINAHPVEADAPGEKSNDEGDPDDGPARIAMRCGHAGTKMGLRDSASRSGASRRRWRARLCLRATLACGPFNALQTGLSSTWRMRVLLPCWTRAYHRAYPRCSPDSDSVIVRTRVPRCSTSISANRHASDGTVASMVCFFLACGRRASIAAQFVR